VLDATTPNVTYLWQDGSSSPQYSVTQSGNYAVTVTGLCGSATDSVDVTIFPLPVAQLGADTVICTGDTIVLDATWQNAIYQWQDGSASPQFTVTQAGIYTVELTSNGCSSSDTVVITSENCNVIITMPSVFSPNNDNLNDLFIPIQFEGIEIAKLMIYNRWGNLVSETNNLLSGWDGSDLPAGTYFWVVPYTDVNGRSGTLKGSVLLAK
jgi:gliding motility-associated-like protein